jgi:hypothetical protein
LPSKTHRRATTCWSAVSFAVPDMAPGAARADKQRPAGLQRVFARLVQRRAMDVRCTSRRLGFRVEMPRVRMPARCARRRTPVSCTPTRCAPSEMSRAHKAPQQRRETHRPLPVPRKPPASRHEEEGICTLWLQGSPFFCESEQIPSGERFLPNYCVDQFRSKEITVMCQIQCSEKSMYTIPPPPSHSQVSEVGDRGGPTPMFR